MCVLVYALVRTLAARTRSIVKAAGLLDDNSEARETASAGTEEALRSYAIQREKLREAAEAIASGKAPGVDLRAFVASAEALESSGDAAEKSGA